MCHFWAPLLFFSYLVLILDHSLLIAYLFAILVTFRDILSYISRGTNLLSICGLSAICQRLSFLSHPVFLGQAYFLWVLLSLARGPSALPCRVVYLWLFLRFTSLSLMLLNLIGSLPVCPLVSRSWIWCGVSIGSHHRCLSSLRVWSSLGYIHRILHKTVL